MDLEKQKMRFALIPLAKRTFSTGGDKGSRTPDLLNAIETLYQLSYIPIRRLAYIIAKYSFTRQDGPRPNSGRRRSLMRTGPPDRLRAPSSGRPGISPVHRPQAAVRHACDAPGESRSRRRRRRSPRRCRRQDETTQRARDGPERRVRRRRRILAHDKAWSQRCRRVRAEARLNCQRRMPAGSSGRAHAPAAGPLQASASPR